MRDKPAQLYWPYIHYEPAVRTSKEQQQQQRVPVIVAAACLAGGVHITCCMQGQASQRNALGQMYMKVFCLLAWTPLYLVKTIRRADDSSAA